MDDKLDDKQDDSLKVGLRAALAKLLLSLMGIGIGLGCAEVVMRIVAPPFFRSPMRAYEPDLGWTGNPDSVNYRRRDYGLIRFEVNSQGFRDLPHTRETRGLPLKRIVLIGDSFAEAAQVELHKTFAIQLKDLLNDDPKEYWEVQNLGMGDYGTAQELITLEKFGLAYEPDLVILQVFPLNDIVNNSMSAAYMSSLQDTYRPYFDPDDDFQSITYLNPITSWIRRNLAIGRYSTHILQSRWGAWGRERFFLNDAERLAWVEQRCLELGLPEGFNQPLFLMNIFSPHDEQLSMIQEGWSATEQGILSIYRKVKASGAQMMVLVVPHIRQLGPYWTAWSPRVPFAADADYADRRIAELLQDEPVPVVSLLQPFNESFDLINPYLEGHFNLETHEFVADILDRAVRDLMGKPTRVSGSPSPTLEPRSPSTTNSSTTSPSPSDSDPTGSDLSDS